MRTPFSEDVELPVSDPTCSSGRRDRAWFLVWSGVNPVHENCAGQLGTSGIPAAVDAGVLDAGHNQPRTRVWGVPASAAPPPPVPSRVHAEGSRAEHGFCTHSPQPCGIFWAKRVRSFPLRALPDGGNVSQKCGWVPPEHPHNQPAK
jgi:hypothetical protein